MAQSGEARKRLEPLLRQLGSGSNPGLLFLGGSQGSGKSTLARRLAEEGRAAVLSLDDFYLSRRERERLAAKVSPLFTTRGPPGTHDLRGLNEVLDALLEERETTVPRFDKLRDERAEAHQVVRPAPLIVLEGWLLGALADPKALGEPPMNEVEACDRDGAWRRYQEELLACDYAALFDRADAFAYLLPRRFEQVHDWRCRQEEDLLGIERGTLPPTRRTELSRFVMHFERLTRRMMEGQRREGRAITLDSSHRPLP
ncbi:AAA family ATPase [Parvularcula maris]|uniref:Zeta toxin family protein n=1 Tax=Parvularcula maris TaxID=2965077 RepID=A0A9X2L6K5_9PROT|nr:AAA family ATPase [Parvularcula maris]MCQ8184054.1 zeta toxin family protein [Parvularcula maris]